ncbi:NTP transferase domain-containing protein [Microbacterium indicum]|uniref:NTP transferase domain-containing protein n=1 Tax=Microbacterium indicum TaxID=358100 RepID=UPI00040F6390|nr:NTP transferase domain-containing protein [Microbacterium indicum]
MTRVAGVILAGGRASRVGGADKALFVVAGRTLLAAAAAALASCDEVIAVGPERGGAAGVRWVREDPPFGGPVPALRAALATTTADDLLVLPADLPGASAAAALLRVPLAGDGAVLEDPGGRAQWLTARYRRAALERALDEVTEPSMRAVAARLRLERIPAPARATEDVDTWEDLERAKGRATMAENTPEDLESWAAAAAAEVGVDPARVDIAAILDMTREVAHGVARPAAPVTAYIAGLAGGDPEAVAKLAALAQGWRA